MGGPQPKLVRGAALYVGDLHPDITDHELFQFFSAIAPVASVRLVRDSLTSKSRGYAYVNFHTVEEAERVLETHNYSKIRGRPCRIMWSERNPAVRRSGVGNLYVSNLSAEVDPKDLHDRFSEFGNVVSCKISSNPETGKSRGYGFVQFETPDAADKAMEAMDGLELSGQAIKVEKYKPKAQRLSAMRWTNCYVKHFPSEWDEEKLMAFFAEVGEVSSVKVSRGPDGSAKFGFVNFVRPEDAKTAVNKLDGADVGYRLPLLVTRHQKKVERERALRTKFMKEKKERASRMAGRNVYVKNLGEAVTEEAVRELFEPYGTVESVRLERRDGALTGVAYVLFGTPEEAQKAIGAMHMKPSAEEGKPMYVQLWQPKDLRAQEMARRKQQQMRMQAVPPMLRGMRPQDVMAMQMQFFAFMQQQQQQQAMPQGQGMRRGGAPPSSGGRRGGDAGQGQRGFRMTPNARNMAGPSGGAPMGVPFMAAMQAMHPSMMQSMMMAAQQQRMGMPPMMQPGMQPVPGMAGPTGPAGAGAVPPAAVGGAGAAPVPVAAAQPSGSDLARELANMPETQAKNALGERLYPRIEEREPERAGKITGMLLEGMEVSELINLLDDQAALEEKIHEALHVLNQHEQ